MIFMSLLHDIEKTHFSPSEEEVIKYVLDKKDEIENMTLAMIAEETYTSAPILVRVAKKLGFNGWNEFKEAFLSEIDYLNKEAEIDASIPFVVSDTYTTIASNIAKLEMESIQDTLDLLSHDDLQKAMRLLSETSHIDVYGISNNLLLAQEFAEKMFYIDKNVNIATLSGDAKMQATMSNETHCAILISYSGETNFMVDVAEILSNKHTPMISITSLGDNSLSAKAQVNLRISSKEMIQTKIGDFSSSQSIKTILDILYGCIFSLNYEENLENKIQFAKELEDRHSGFEFIDE